MASNPPAAPVVVGTHPQLIRGYQLDPSRLEPYKAIQLQIHRAQRLEGFGPTFPELPRLVYLTIFNCHPTSQAIEHARKFPPPADWVCPWPEPDPSSGLATNKLLELRGDRYLNLTAAEWAETQCESKTEHRDVTLTLTRNAVLAHFGIKLGLLSCPDIKIARNDQWQLVRWFSNTDPNGIPVGLPPKFIPNLVEALGGGVSIASGPRALRELFQPYFQQFGPYASHPVARLSRDHSEKYRPEDYERDDCVKKLVSLIRKLNRTSRKEPLKNLGRSLNTAVEMTSFQAHELKIGFTSDGVLIPTYAQFMQCGSECLQRMIFDVSMLDKSYMYLEQGGETLVPYISAITSLIMSPAILGVLAKEQDLISQTDFGTQKSASFDTLADVFIASFGCYHRHFRHDLSVLEPYMLKIVYAAESVVRPLLKRQIELLRAERERWIREGRYREN